MIFVQAKFEKKKSQANLPRLSKLTLQSLFLSKYQTKKYFLGNLSIFDILLNYRISWINKIEWIKMIHC